MEQKQSAGAIWKKSINTKKGPMEVLSITIGEQRYTGWPNSYKKNPKEPDYRLEVDNWKPEPKTQPSAPVQKKEDYSDSLPF